MTYDRQFYDVINAGSARSAEIIVPIVLAYADPCHGDGTDAYIVDVGCGEGVWTAEFARHGCSVLGIDGPHIDPARLLISDACFVAQDLTHERIDRGDRPFDLAVSLEVAEHLPDRRAATFIEDLCRLAPRVLFSAAIPGQGGTGHVNEQWPAYWVDLFEGNGFVVTGALRWLFWREAMDGVVENWYAQNMLYAVHRDALNPREHILFDGTAANDPRLAVVHPVLYDARRTR